MTPNPHGRASLAAPGAMPAGARRTALRLLAVTLLAAGCTDVDILLPEVQPPPPPEQKPNALMGQVCTEDPQTIVFPVKVWLVIDDSGSMQQNDPNQGRYNAAIQLAMRLNAPGRVFFGGQVFAGDQTRRFTNPRFNDNTAQFIQQVQAQSNAGNGQTPYLGALNLAISEIDADIRESGAVAKRTRYVVIFLSDGVPTDSQPPDIYAAVNQMMTLKERCGGLTLNTVYLGGAGGPAGLLQEMARLGEGRYKSFPNGDSLDFTDFDFQAIRRSYVDRFFLVTNRTMVPDGKTQLVDSDMDAMSDEEETKLGLNPLSRDTDADGCNDALEMMLGWDPKSKKAGECVCKPEELTADPDNDGLSSCEEGWLGTLKSDPDSDIGKLSPTDGDLVIDGLDFFVLKDATFPNISTDRDLDGVLDIEELREHTAVTVNDVDRARFKYNYTLFAKNPTNERCFDFEVHNVMLGRTAATAEHAADENIIELHFAQSAQDNPHNDRIFRVARIKVPYAEANAVIKVTPDQFKAVMPP
jgi:hypothetical protein